MKAVDTNILVYAHRAEFAQNQSAVRCLKSFVEGDEDWGIPLFAVNEFLRVVTHKVMNPPSSVKSALGFVNHALDSPRCAFRIPGNRYRSEFARLISEADLSGNDIFDAAIAAVCIENGVGEIVTEDCGFPKFRGFRITRLG